MLQIQFTTEGVNTPEEDLIVAHHYDGSTIHYHDGTIKVSQIVSIRIVSPSELSEFLKNYRSLESFKSEIERERKRPNFIGW